MRKFILLSLLLASTTSFAFIGGELAKTGQFPSVVWIEYGCTGNLIARDAILIAGHCVTTFKNDYRHFVGQPLRLYTKPIAMGSTPVTAQIKEIFVHSDWQNPLNEGVDYFKILLNSAAADAAVLKLDRSIENEEGLKISKLSFEKLKKGAQVFVGGYGCEEVGAQARDPKYKFAVKKISSNLQKYFFTPQQDANGKSKSMGCEGDSGGPAFVKSPKGELQQIGVNSRVRGDETDGRMRVLYLFSIQQWLKDIGY